MEYWNRLDRYSHQLCYTPGRLKVKVFTQDFKIGFLNNDGYSVVIFIGG